MASPVFEILQGFFDIHSIIYRFNSISNDADLGFMYIELMHSLANQSILGITEKADYTLMLLPKSI